MKPPCEFDMAVANFIKAAGLDADSVEFEHLKSFILRIAVPKAYIPEILAELRDELATIEHERWSHWQLHLHGKCHSKPDEPGALVIPPDLAIRWAKQATSPFSKLTELEKASDREQVDRYLPLLADRLSATCTPRP